MRLALKGVVILGVRLALEGVANLGVRLALKGVAILGVRLALKAVAILGVRLALAGVNIFGVRLVLKGVTGFERVGVLKRLLPGVVAFGVAALERRPRLTGVTSLGMALFGVALLTFILGEGVAGISSTASSSID